MDFKDFVEKEMVVLSEATINVNKTLSLKDKLVEAKLSKKLSEDSVKVLAYLSHIKAVDGNLAKAADNLGRDRATLHSKDPKKNPLLALEIPEELWRIEK